MPRSTQLSKWLVFSVSGLALAVMALPPVALILRAIRSDAVNRLDESGITTALWLSLRTTSVTALIVVILGIPLAYVLARHEFPMKGIITLIVQLPIVLPPSVAGLALLLTFGRRGILSPILEIFGLNIAFTTQAVILAQVYVALPFFIRAADIGFRNIPEEILDAARVDGASGLRLFHRVTLPLSWHALVAGLMLAWTRALGEFGATILFAGSLAGKTQTMPLLVYNALERDVDTAIWTGIILIAFAVSALGLLQFAAQYMNQDTKDYFQL